MMEDISLRTVEEPSVSDNDDIGLAPNKNQGLTGAKIFSATFCCYTVFDFDDPMLCGRQKSDGFCISTRSW